jgi:hypothetical protein
MVNFVVYSHSSYVEVLEIQSDYVSKNTRATLLIDKNDLDLNHIYEKFDKVIFYDSIDTYPVRLSKSISQIDSEYILLIHDIDILLNYNVQILESLQQFLIDNYFDRIDLKHTPKKTEGLNYIVIQNTGDEIKYEKVETINNENYCLVGQKDPSNYIYNVNPSIWKRESLIDIMNKFPQKNYRTIEDFEVQNYCKKFNIFKIYSQNNLKCGYFECVDFFVFLHISHTGKLLPFNNSFTTVYGQSYVDIKDEYEKIINKYNLKNSKKWQS